MTDFEMTLPTGQIGPYSKDDTFTLIDPSYLDSEVEKSIGYEFAKTGDTLTIVGHSAIFFKTKNDVYASTIGFTVFSGCFLAIKEPCSVKVKTTLSDAERYCYGARSVWVFDLLHDAHRNGGFL